MLQVNALVKLYSQQGNTSGAVASSQSGGKSTRFDMLG